MEVQEREIDRVIDYIRSCQEAKEKQQAELPVWLDGDDGLKPYLRLKDKGMPKDKINQIAWLLLNGSGCGFCKICRDKPCDIKDDEGCTNNIANYIRKIVLEEAESEIQQYRAIGTVEECREAKEKQRAKRPELYGDFEDGKLLCPNCEGDLMDLAECGFDCCPYCGQAIDWSDAD